MMLSVIPAVKRDTWPGHVLTNPRREERNENGTHHSEEGGAAEDEALTM